MLLEQIIVFLGWSYVWLGGPYSNFLIYRRVYMAYRHKETTGTNFSLGYALFNVMAASYGFTNNDRGFILFSGLAILGYILHIAVCRYLTLAQKKHSKSKK